MKKPLLSLPLLVITLNASPLLAMMEGRVDSAAEEKRGEVQGSQNQTSRRSQELRDAAAKETLSRSFSLEGKMRDDDAGDLQEKAIPTALSSSHIDPSLPQGTVLPVVSNALPAPEDLSPAEPMSQIPLSPLLEGWNRDMERRDRDQAILDEHHRNENRSHIKRNQEIAEKSAREERLQIEGEARLARESFIKAFEQWNQAYASKDSSIFSKLLSRSPLLSVTEAEDKAERAMLDDLTANRRHRNLRARTSLTGIDLNGKLLSYAEYDSWLVAEEEFMNTVTDVIIQRDEQAKNWIPWTRSMSVEELATQAERVAQLAHDWEKAIPVLAGEAELNRAAEIITYWNRTALRKNDAVAEKLAQEEAERKAQEEAAERSSSPHFSDDERGVIPSAAATALKESIESEDPDYDTYVEAWNQYAKEHANNP